VHAGKPPLQLVRGQRLLQPLDLAVAIGLEQPTAESFTFSSRRTRILSLESERGMGVPIRAGPAWPVRMAGSIAGRAARRNGGKLIGGVEVCPSW
jgi:hypothetical protein